jgi:hypothetical protein
MLASVFCRDVLAMKLRPVLLSACSFFSQDGAVRRRAAAALGLCAIAVAGQPALAAGERSSPPAQQGVASPRSAHEPLRRRLTKYESRKMRHACAARAGERGLAGAERDAFIAACYAARLSHRGERQRCRQEAAAKGLDKAALRDFLRDCVKDRSRE